METATLDTVLQAGSVKSRMAKVYAEALLAAASRQNAVDAAGDELSQFIHDVLDAAPEIEPFLASPVVGKKAKAAALQAALPGRASELLRGLIAVLTSNGRLGLLRGVAAAYHQLLAERAGRVPVSITSAVPLSESQRASLTSSLTQILSHEPTITLKVDPDIIGGLVIRYGDRVIDTSIRTRLQSLRGRLLKAPM